MSIIISKNLILIDYIKHIEIFQILIYRAIKKSVFFSKNFSKKLDYFTKINILNIINGI